MRLRRASIGVSVALLCFTAAVVVPRSALAHEDAKNWTTDHWTTRQGLPQNSVTDLLQDRDGYIWITTFGGIARFDGLTFDVLRSANTQGLTSERFLAVVQAPDGAIWFGSQDRGAYRYADGVATQVGPHEGILDLAVGPDGAIWAVTRHSVLRFEGDEIVRRAVLGDQWSITTLPSGALAVPRLDGTGGMHCLVGDCGELGPGPPGLAFQRWHVLDDATLIAARQGIYIQERGGSEWRALTASRGIEMRSFKCTEWRGELHCGGDRNPMPVDHLRAEREPMLLGEGGAAAISMLEDREGGLWVGTDGDGLMRLQPQDSERHDFGFSTFSVAPAPGGGVWATDYFNLIAIDATAPPARLSPEWVHLWPDGRGGALLADPSGIVRLDAERRVVSTTAFDDEGLTLHSPIEGDCFALDETLFRIEGDVPVRAVSAADLGAERARVIRCTDAGVWMVLDEERLVLWDHDIVRSIPVQDLQSVRDLLVRGERVWVATYGSGLAAVRGESIQARLTPNEGMCDYAVSHIFDTEDGDLWFNTNRGMGRVSEAELEGAVTSGVSVLCTLVGTAEGNGPGGLRTADGRLWAPTISGVAEVDPRKVREAQSPHPVLDRATYGDESLLTEAHAVRGPGSLIVAYSAIYFLDPRAVLYRYRLRGRNEQWSASTTTRLVHFEDLPPGAYTFEVQARGRGGWDEMRSLSFERRALWWETAMAQTGLPFVLALFALGLVGWLLARTRAHNRTLRHEVDERGRAERELAEQQATNTRIQRGVEAGRRLEALGRLAGGVAHDFNNLLTVFAAQASFLIEHSDADVREEAQALLDGVDRGSALTRGLLVFGTGDQTQARNLELGESVKELVPMLRRLIRADIELEFGSEMGCNVLIARGRLDQVVTNLVLNARDAIEGPGHIHLTVRRAGEEWVELEVRDDGCGLDEESLASAFTPYFTTKTLGEGTGLGLTTVHGAVEEANGEIRIESEEGVGTSVLVRLPWSAARTPTDEHAILHDDAALQGLRVLVVEDRPEVRSAVRLMLARLGCTVREAETLKEAVLVAQRSEIDLLLTDLVMPGGSGPEVRRAVLDVRPGLPVVYMTGYSAQLLDGRHDDVPLLRKPFNRAELSVALHRVLGSA